MKNFIKKILNLPVYFYIALALSGLFIYSAKSQGLLDYQTLLIIIGLGVLIFSYLYSGINALKISASIGVVIYITSLYTVFISIQNQMIVQPFFLTIASITGFLSQTYEEDNHIYDLRSRSLWTTILIIILFLIKTSLVLFNVKYWVVEALGIIIAIAYTYSWKHWIRNSKATKIIEPSILEREVEGVFNKIYINNTLDVNEQIWTRGSFYKTENSYPFIYNEVMKAREEGQLLMIVSKIATSNIYDLGEITVNKSTKIPYLYIEAKNDTYYDNIVERFIKEITRSKYNGII